MVVVVIVVEGVFSLEETSSKQAGWLACSRTNGSSKCDSAEPTGRERESPAGWSAQEVFGKT